MVAQAQRQPAHSARGFWSHWRALPVSTATQTAVAPGGGKPFPVAVLLALAAAAVTAICCFAASLILLSLCDVPGSLADLDIVLYLRVQASKVVGYECLRSIGRTFETVSPAPC